MDDNFDILDILGQLLRDERYKVTLSSNPLDVEMVDQIEPDVIITEAVFHGTTAGLEAITHLVADARTRDIPIIYCTLLPHIVQLSPHANLPVIRKPFELDDVLEAVSSAVERAGSTDQPASLN
jgi:CheY-like chemotaxis protein